MISKPRTALGGGLLAAVLLVSGCQTRVGSAATVGDDTISTKTLNASFNTAAASAGSASKETLRREVLAELVQRQAARVVARRLGVSTSPGDIEVALVQVKQTQDANGQSLPDNLVQLEAELQAIETNLATYYAKHGRTPDQDHVLGFQVKDKATGQQVVAKIAPGGTNLAKLAATYRSDRGTGTTLGTVGISQLPELKGLKVGQSTVATVANNSSGTTTAFYYVLYVDKQLDQQDVTKALSEVKVRINPRFGTWSQDSTGTFQVIPATSDIVAPVPSGEAAPPAPEPSAPAPSAPAPSAPAPSAAAPSAAAPSAPAGPAPSATPPTSAAPSATTAPAPTETPSVAPSS